MPNDLTTPSLAARSPERVADPKAGVIMDPMPGRSVGEGRYVLPGTEANTSGISWAAVAAGAFAIAALALILLMLGVVGALLDLSLGASRAFVEDDWRRDHRLAHPDAGDRFSDGRLPRRQASHQMGKHPQ